MCNILGPYLLSADIKDFCFHQHVYWPILKVNLKKSLITCKHLKLNLFFILYNIMWRCLNSPVAFKLIDFRFSVLFLIYLDKI